MLHQLPGRELVRHLQQVPQPTEEIIRLHIPDPLLKDLHIPDLQTAVSEQHSQGLPVPTGQVQGHSQPIQDRQVVQQAGLIRVIQVKVQLQDLLQHLHTQGQAQAGQIATHVRAVQAQAGVIPVRADRAQAEAIQDLAVPGQAEVILHQAVQAVPDQAGVTLHQAAQVVQVDLVPAVQVDPAALAVQDRVVAEGR